MWHTILNAFYGLNHLLGELFLAQGVMQVWSDGGWNQSSWELAGLLSPQLATKILHVVSPHGPGWTFSAGQPWVSGTAYMDTRVPTWGLGLHSLSFSSIATYAASLPAHSLGYEPVEIPLRIKERAVRLYLFLRKWQYSSIAYDIVVAFLENTISHR